MGLQLLQRELEAENCSRAQLDTLKDIRESCDIALDTLNELLTFDKVESGLMVLEREFLCPVDFLQNTVRPFYVMVSQSTVSQSLLHIH